MRLPYLLTACLCLIAGCASEVGEEWRDDAGDSEIFYETKLESPANRTPLPTSVKVEPGRVTVSRASSGDGGTLSPDDADAVATEEDAVVDDTGNATESDTGTDAYIEYDSGVDDSGDSSQASDAGADSSLPSDSGDTDSGQAGDSSADDSSSADSDQEPDSTVTEDSSTEEDSSQRPDTGQVECSVTACEPIGDGGTQRERQSFASVESQGCSDGADSWTEERVCDLDEMCQFSGGTWDCKPCEYSSGTMTSLVYNPDGAFEQVIDCYGCRCSSWWLSSGPGCPDIFPVTLDFVPSQKEPGVDVKFTARVSAAGGLELFPDPEGGSTVESFGMVSFERVGTSATFEFWVTGKVYEAGSWVKYLTTARLRKSCV